MSNSFSAEILTVDISMALFLFLFVESRGLIVWDELVVCSKIKIIPLFEDLPILHSCTNYTDKLAFTRDDRHPSTGGISRPTTLSAMRYMLYRTTIYEPTNVIIQEKTLKVHVEWIPIVFRMKKGTQTAGRLIHFV